MCREANLASSSSWMYIAYNIYWSLFIFIWYQDASLIYFQLISTLIVTPYWPCFCFRQQGGEHCFYCFDWQKGEERFLPLILFMVLIVYPFVDDWQKGGERFEFDIWFLSLYAYFGWVYMHSYVFAYIKFNIV